MSTDNMQDIRLSDDGAELFDRLIQDFKDKMKKAADEVLSTLYTDVIGYIEHDALFNLRGDIVSAFSKYSDGGAYKEDLKKLREHIIKHHRDELIADLNQDSLDKIKELEETIEFLQKMRRF